MTGPALAGIFITDGVWLTLKSIGLWDFKSGVPDVELLLSSAGLFTAYDALWKVNSTSMSYSPVFLKGIRNFYCPGVLFLIANGINYFSVIWLLSSTGTFGLILFMQTSLGIWTWPARRISSFCTWVTFFLSLRKSFILPLNLFFRNSSKLSETPNFSSA